VQAPGRNGKGALIKYDHARSKEAGCDLFFAKPADPKELRHILNVRSEELLTGYPEI
jgi:hypothetical protein